MQSAHDANLRKSFFSCGRSIMAKNDPCFLHGQNTFVFVWTVKVRDRSYAASQFAYLHYAQKVCTFFDYIHFGVAYAHNGTY